MSRVSFPVRRLIWFLVIMLVLTAVSRAVYVAGLPQVSARKIAGGYLKRQVTPDAMQLVSDAQKNWQLCAVKLPEALTVQQVLVTQNQRVLAGETILQFWPEWGMRALEKTGEALDQANVERLLWMQGHARALSQLVEQEAELAKRTRGTKAEIAAREKQLQQIREDIHTLQDEHIWNGVLGSTVDSAYESAKTAHTVLTQLSKAGWKVTAPCDLWMTGVYLQAEDRYEGIQPLYGYIPTSAALRVGFRCAVEPAFVDAAQSITLRTPTGLMDETWRYLSATKEEHESWLWAEPVSGDASLAADRWPVFELETVYQDMLVPVSAVVTDGIYVLERRTGAWGTAEDVARFIPGTYALSDSANVAFQPSVPASADLVIVDWDRPLFHNAPVYVHQME